MFSSVNILMIQLEELLIRYFSSQSPYLRVLHSITIDTLYILFCMQLPAHFKLMLQTRKVADKNKVGNNKRKAKCAGEKAPFNECRGIDQKARLASLDVFAGCGGLSEGLQQSGKLHCSSRLTAFDV